MTDIDYQCYPKVYERNKETTTKNKETKKRKMKQTNKQKPLWQLFCEESIKITYLGPKTR